MDSASGSANSQTPLEEQSRNLLGTKDNHRNYQGTLQPKSFPSLPEDWTSEWETFASSDGKLQLHSVLHHKKDWSGQRTLVILHGMGEHGGRYLHFTHYLRGEFDAVYCLDHRGHGRSEGLRGHISSFDLFSDDAALAIHRLESHLKKRFGHSEIHLFGHSMGGLITLQTIMKYPELPIHSVCVSAPLLRVAVEIPKVKEIAGRVLAKVWGSLQLTSEVDPADLSHDQEVVHTYRADRLVHNKITSHFFIEMEKAMESTRVREGGFTYPLMMIIPLADRVVDSDTSLEFFRNLKLRDKLLKTYPDFYHESFNEIGKEQVFADLSSWFAQWTKN